MGFLDNLSAALDKGVAGASRMADTASLKMKVVDADRRRKEALVNLGEAVVADPAVVEALSSKICVAPCSTAMRRSASFRRRLPPLRSRWPKKRPSLLPKRPEPPLLWAQRWWGLLRVATRRCPTCAQAAGPRLPRVPSSAPTAESRERKNRGQIPDTSCKIDVLMVESFK